MKPTKLPIAITLLLALSTRASAKEIGLPQLDPTWFANQLFWLVICFGILFFIVSRVIIPSVSGVLGTREKTIAEAIEKAEAYKKTATAAKMEFTNASQDVHQKVSAMIAKAQADAAQATTAAMAKLNAELDAKMQAANRALEQALIQAKPQMEAATADVARTIAEKLLGTEVDAATVASALKKAA